ncbi:hypothetical protein HPB47_011012 [Ixodes persulcatus]|uniref:Uncharacterized protein n=1 Tax=Ixodes persulcatus TaxID=34615 RepID=A0AC60NXH7_IXOPE|nr:hypothetical protein HPB47_011012 [Ixodes persulcatus]
MIADELENVHLEFRIQNKDTRVVTDNGSNYVKAFRCGNAMKEKTLLVSAVLLPRFKLHFSAHCNEQAVPLEMRRQRRDTHPAPAKKRRSQSRGDLTPASTVASRE